MVSSGQLRELTELAKDFNLEGAFMNDPIFSAKKFEDLIKLAKVASTSFEEAAVFTATQALAMEFDKEEHFSGYVLENIERVRWHICAAVGYDITNGHHKEQH